MVEKQHRPGAISRGVRQRGGREEARPGAGLGGWPSSLIIPGPSSPGPGLVSICVGAKNQQRTSKARRLIFGSHGVGIIARTTGASVDDHRHGSRRTGVGTDHRHTSKDQAFQHLGRCPDWGNETARPGNPWRNRSRLIRLPHRAAPPIAAFRDKRRSPLAGPVSPGTIEVPSGSPARPRGSP